jgi:uncharacterized protein (DUF1697 family)
MGRVVGQVSLLRGINVGGNVLVGMSRLREIYGELGLDDVRTHLQSGNVAFRSDRDPDDISRHAEAALHREFGRAIRVLGRTHADLARIVADDPFPDADPSRHIVLFLSAKPPADAVARIAGTATAGERVFARGRELHIHYPDGQGRSAVSGALLEKSGFVATARNWRTVSRLLELTAPDV